MNTERNNNNNNNISSGDQRPNFVDVASGRRPSPKLFYIDQQLRGSENPLDFELTLEEEIEKDLMEDVDMGDADNATSPVEENAKPQKEVLDVTVNIQKKKKEELTWTQVKRLITERFDIQTTNFQKGLRLLRISPTFDEDFVDYVDRFTNLFDELTEVNDNKLVVMLFFNSLPKQFRKVIYDKINMITGNKSDETDPFPATWRETAVLFNQHKVMLSNELKKVYVSFGNKDSYAQGLKRDKKAKPTSDNDVASSDNKKYNSLSRHDAIKHHDRKHKNYNLQEHDVDMIDMDHHPVKSFHEDDIDEFKDELNRLKNQKSDDSQYY
ncbi:hypothetical protein BX666DRAFT_2116710 [Dichotomocladium elegans]|nr:hypothetical protein BX666DRAFT_2116710 [Dichotomocladium elegans]